MNQAQWRSFFLIGSSVLGRGSATAALSDSWCAWTTFKRLKEDAGYWTAGFPSAEDAGNIGIADGSAWGQPFLYADIAHIIVPREFYWEKISSTGFDSGRREQNVDALSIALREAGISYSAGDYSLDIKLY